VVRARLGIPQKAPTLQAFHTPPLSGCLCNPPPHSSTVGSLAGSLAHHCGSGSRLSEHSVSPKHSKTLICLLRGLGELRRCWEVPPPHRSLLGRRVPAFYRGPWWMVAHAFPPPAIFLSALSLRVPVWVPAAVSAPRISAVMGEPWANSAFSVACQGIKGERGYTGPSGEKGESVSGTHGAGGRASNSTYSTSCHQGREIFPAACEEEPVTPATPAPKGSSCVSG
jgi:hypothetical protein